MQKEWTNQTNTAVYKYITSTERQQKNIIFERELYENIMCLVDIVLRKNKLKLTTDNQQELIIISLKVLDSITEDKVITSQQFIYNSLRNYTISYLRKGELNTNKMIYSDEMNYTVMIEDKYMYESDEIHKAILDKIDEKIENSKIMNKTNTIFLILLKTFLIENNYDERGFQEFVCKEMNISLEKYRIISSNQKILTKIFRKKILD